MLRTPFLIDVVPFSEVVPLCFVFLARCSLEKECHKRYNCWCHCQASRQTDDKSRRVGGKFYHVNCRENIFKIYFSWYTTLVVKRKVIFIQNIPELITKLIHLLRKWSTNRYFDAAMTRCQHEKVLKLLYLFSITAEMSKVLSACNELERRILF